MTDKKTIQSKLNLLNARLTQLKDEQYYTKEEREAKEAILKTKINTLQQRVDYSPANEITVIDPVELLNSKS